MIELRVLKKMMTGFLLTKMESQLRQTDLLMPKIFQKTELLW